MSRPATRRTARFGGLLIVGSALVAAAVLGLEWRLAPGSLRSPVVVLVLVGAGLILLFSSLFTYLDDRWSPPSAPAPTRRPMNPAPESSLMTLPALVGAPPEPSGSAPGPSIEVVSPSLLTPSVTERVGLGADVPTHSTLLIPFADGGIPAAPSPSPPVTGLTVTRMVDRMDALQRAAPSPPAPAPLPTPVSDTGSPGSTLLLRLTRIPTPPTVPVASGLARRCNDCGDPLGSPPHFEPCGDCGRALCERCYWRTASGPQAHVCTSCLQARAGPRPPAPAVTFGRPTAAVPVSTPSVRTLQPRRPVN